MVANGISKKLYVTVSNYTESQIEFRISTNNIVVVNVGSSYVINIRKLKINLSLLFNFNKL